MWRNENYVGKSRRNENYVGKSRRNENYVGKSIERMDVSGKRGKGRPKKRWKNCINRDLREKGLLGNEVHNRADWRRLTINADPT